MLPVHTKLPHLWRDRGLGEAVLPLGLGSPPALCRAALSQGEKHNLNEKSLVSDTVRSGFSFRNLQVEQELSGGSCLPQELTGTSVQQCQFVK